MKYENFLKIIQQIQEQDSVVNKLYDQKIDFLDFVDPYHRIISSLFIEIYGEGGWDWISWFCYETDYGKKEMGAWDENDQPICRNLEELHEFLEKNHKKMHISEESENIAETVLTLEQRIDLALLDKLFEPLEAISYNEEQLMDLLDSYNIPRKV
jgi:hypothetical protein